MENLLAQFQPILVEIGGTVLAAVIGWAALWAKAHFKASTTKLLQDVFQKGLENAAGFGLNEASMTDIKKGLTPDHPAVQAGVDYLNKAVPDTLKKLAKQGMPASPFDLAEKVIAKMMVLTAGQTK